jgi:hypothetical protein
MNQTTLESSLAELLLPKTIYDLYRQTEFVEAQCRIYQHPNLEPDFIKRGTLGFVSDVWEEDELIVVTFLTKPDEEGDFPEVLCYPHEIRPLCDDELAGIPEMLPTKEQAHQLASSP